MTATIDAAELLVHARAFSRAHLRGDIGHVSADDVAQEICIAILASQHPTHRGYRAVIMRHKLVDAIRERYRHKADPWDWDVLPEPAATTRTPEEAAIHADLRARLDAALATLPTRERHVVSMRFLDGYTTPEIGALLHLTPGHVRIIQMRALRTLRATATKGHQ